LLRLSWYFLPSFALSGVLTTATPVSRQKQKPAATNAGKIVAEKTLCPNPQPCQEIFAGKTKKLMHKVPFVSGRAVGEIPKGEWQGHNG
jgi:hypothetical protein